MDSLSNRCVILIILISESMIIRKSSKKTESRHSFGLDKNFKSITGTLNCFKAMSREKTTEDHTNLPEWLNENVFIDILDENVPNFERIKNYTVKPAVETGENFMTLLLNVKIDVVLKDGTTTQTSFMCKVLPKIEKMQEMLKEWQVFDKELECYQSYIPEFESMYKAVGLNINFGPRVFKTGYTEAPKELIIMEDLRTRNFQNIKRQKGLNLEHTQKALEKLAQFHAASACRYELKGQYPDIYKKCLCSKQDLFADYRNATVTLLTSFLPLYDAEHLKEKLIAYTAVAPDQFQVESAIDVTEFNVLNHGDCWSNNIMFKYNDADGSIAETFFVDYQMSRYGSPAHDLNYLLISSTELKNKINKFDYFVSFYHEKLVKYLKLLQFPKKLPTLKEIHIAILRHGDWAYTIITTVMPVLLLDPTEKANMDNIIDEGQNGDELKKLMFTNSRYVAHMKELLPWLDNRGLFVYQM